MTNIILDEPKPIEPLNYEHVAEICMQVIKKTPGGKIPYIFIPTSLPKDTKMNRVRLVPADRSSPFGVIVREGHDVYADMVYDTSSARFNAMEVVAWIAQYMEKNDA